MFKKLGLYYRTIKYLKLIQIRYRLWYMLRDILRNFTGHSYPIAIPQKSYNLELAAGTPKPETCNQQPGTRNPQSATHFIFLNQSYAFQGGINWNFGKYGKLWAYNLNYFDYLGQESIDKEQGQMLIRQFIERIHENREGMEPYPISLRGINWIKFLSSHEIKDDAIDASLYAQYRILFDNIEYHIMGNHLLENGCSLLFGAYYFRDKEFLRRSKEILHAQLEEQILNDGAHFERSPMYHKILLDRLLDCINLLTNNTSWRDEERLRSVMKTKAQQMLGWLQQISFENGDVPHLNDSTAGIAPGKKELESYAHSLRVKPAQVSLDESGYRKFQKDDFELLVDVGEIGPDYQPGHAHSDTLSFILYHKKLPVFIDTGISTYEASERRNMERGTAAHNTVRYADIEQSEVWKAFRVGRRAKSTIISEDEELLRASHNGYKHLNITHVREWKMLDNGIIITDSIRGNVKENSTAYFHIHPDFEPYQKTDQIFQIGNLTLSLTNVISSQIKRWQYPKGYNCFSDGYKIEVIFDQELESHITY